MKYIYAYEIDEYSHRNVPHVIIEFYCLFLSRSQYYHVFPFEENISARAWNKTGRLTLKHGRQVYSSMFGPEMNRAFDAHLKRLVMTKPERA